MRVTDIVNFNNHIAKVHPWRLVFREVNVEVFMSMCQISLLVKGLHLSESSG